MKHSKLARMIADDNRAGDRQAGIERSPTPNAILAFMARSDTEVASTPGSQPTVSTEAAGESFEQMAAERSPEASLMTSNRWCAITTTEAEINQVNGTSAGRSGTASRWLGLAVERTEKPNNHASETV